MTVEGEEMAPTESTQSESPSALDRSRGPRTATERIAQALKRDGYNVTYRGRETASPPGSQRATEFIEVDITSDERDHLADYVEELEPSDAHRIIGPDDTPALRRWPRTSAGEGNDGSTRTVIIAPLAPNEYTSEEQDRLRASHL